ncbi:PAS domain S-box protein, partial [bacterium]|nr:PAS domain S-box protein [bacterium]
FRSIGHEPQEFTPSLEKLQEHLHQEDVEHMQKHADAALFNNEDYNLEFRYLYNKGEIRYIQAQGEVIRDENGKAVKFFGTQLDITEHKQAEEALKKSEEKYRLLFETIPIGVDYTNREGDIIGLNPAMLEITGYSLEEAKKVNILNMCVDPNEGLKLRTILNKEGKVKNFETQLKRKDGSIYQALMNCRQTKIGENDVNLCTIFDQTSSKELEKAIRESKEKFQKIFEEGPLGMSVLNYDFDYIDVNPALCKMLGYTREELLTMTFSDITHPEDIENDLKLSKKLFDEEISIHKIEKRYIKKDGSILNVKISASVIHDDKGKFLYGVGMIEDYTEQKQIKEEILREKKTAQNYLDIVGVMLIAIDEQQRITLINKKGSSLLGYDENEILGKNWFDSFIPERLREEIKTVFQKLMLGEIDPVEYYENPVVTRRGEEYLIAWHNTVIRNEQGNITGILSSGLDITKERKSDESLKDSESKYQILVENSLQGIAIIQDEKYQYVNPAFARTIGSSVEEMLDLSSEDIWDLIHPDDKKELEQRNVNLHNGLPLAPIHRFRYIRSDGLIKWVESQVAVIQYTGQPALQIFEIDITEQRLSEKTLQKRTMELERSNKALEQFAYATSHDL